MKWNRIKQNFLYGALQYNIQLHVSTIPGHLRDPSHTARTRR